MKEVKIGKAVIPVEEQKIADANIIKVIAGTTGWGEDKYDCHTYFALVDEACTNLEAVVIKDKNGEDDKIVAIYLNGESELVTFICALKFALNTLAVKAKESIPGFDLEKAYAERVKDYTEENV